MTETALLGLAAVIGLWLHHPMFKELFWRPGDLGWGLLATLPMLLVFGWLLRSRAGSGIRRFFELVVRPVFGGWSLGQLAIISILAGLCEEVLFRGALQGGITDVAGRWPGLLAASVAFGLAHPFSKRYIALATLVGLFLGGLFLATGNLLAPIVAHSVYDFCALAWFLRLHRDPVANAG